MKEGKRVRHIFPSFFPAGMLYTCCILWLEAKVQPLSQYHKLCRPCPFPPLSDLGQCRDFVCVLRHLRLGVVCKRLLGQEGPVLPLSSSEFLIERLGHLLVLPLLLRIDAAEGPHWIARCHCDLATRSRRNKSLFSLTHSVIAKENRLMTGRNESHCFHFWGSYIHQNILVHLCPNAFPAGTQNCTSDNLLNNYFTGPSVVV